MVGERIGFFDFIGFGYKELFIWILKVRFRVFFGFFGEFWGIVFFCVSFGWVCSI